jgi:hypothetical protein
MIKPIEQNSEFEGKEELFDNIIGNFTSGKWDRMLEGKEKFQSLPKETLMLFLKYLSQRPDKAEIHKKLVLELEKSLEM